MFVPCSLCVWIELFVFVSSRSALFIVSLSPTALNAEVPDEDEAPSSDALDQSQTSRVSELEKHTFLKGCAATYY